MKMNEDEFQRVTQGIRKKWTKSNGCPLCGENKWGFSENIFKYEEFHRGQAVTDKSLTMPVILIACTNCGYTFTVNAIAADALSPQKKEEGQK